MRARRFGTAPADLDVAFGEAQPELATAILARCAIDDAGEPVAPDAAWRWSVADRLQALLAILAASHGPALDALCACGDPACGAAIALELPLASLVRRAPPHVEWRDAGNRVLRARMPSGEDLRAWRGHLDDPAWMAARLLASIDGATPQAPWHPTQADVDALDAELEAADPLTALTVPVRCPECGADTPVALDLERLALEALHRRQRTALDDVHRLALAYHWAEADILALPEARRRAYLARLDGETA